MKDIGLDQMKEYLATAIECERNAFAWEETVKDINKKINEITREEELLKKSKMPLNDIFTSLMKNMILYIKNSNY